PPLCTLYLHDALPIFEQPSEVMQRGDRRSAMVVQQGEISAVSCSRVRPDGSNFITTWPLTSTAQMAPSASTRIPCEEMNVFSPRSEEHTSELQSPYDL